MELDKHFTFFLLGGTFILVFLGTFFPPGSYSVTTLLLNYENGFVRRGLFGQMLTWLFPAGMTAGQVNVVAGLMSLSASLALLLFVSASLMRSRFGGSVAFVFVTSIGFAAFTGHIGFLDSILTLLALMGLLAPPGGAGVFVKSVVCAAGVLVHENFLALYAPLISCELWLSRRDGNPLRRIAIAALPLSAAVLSAIAVLSYGSFAAESLNRMLDYYRSRAIGFGIQDRVIETVTATDSGDAKLVDPKKPSLGNLLMTVSQGSVGLFYLTLAFHLLYKLIRQRPVLDRIAVAGAVIAPVTLCFAAYDVSRFIGTSIINVFILIGLLCKEDHKIRETLGQVFNPKWILVFLALNCGLALRDFNSMSTFFYRLPASLIFQLNWFNPPDDVRNEDIGRFRDWLGSPETTVK